MAARCPRSRSGDPAGRAPPRAEPGRRDAPAQFRPRGRPRAVSCARPGARSRPPVRRRRPRRAQGTPAPGRLARRPGPTPAADATPAADPPPAATTPIEAVIFDLDGVIVDSEIWWDEVRRDFARAHGRDWTLEDRAAVMGANSRQWSETMRSRLSLDLDAETIEAAVVDGMVERYAGEGAPAIDGAIDAVRRIAARWPTALASSSHRRAIEAALDATGLADAFRVVVSSDEVAHGKPAPDVFLEAARRLGADPAATLVIEDSINGLRAGRAAGMTTVLVPNRSIPPAAGAEAFADAVVTD